MIISRENVTEVGHNRYTVDASDLRLRPGNFPPRLKTILGNRSTFVARKVHCRPGSAEVLWVEYRQVVGELMLTVFND